MPDIDRYLEACAQRSMDRDEDEWRERMDQLDDAADRAHDEAKDREMEDRS